MRAIEAGRQPLRTVTVGTPLHEVAHLMAAEGLRAVVVTTDDGRPTGIVSERDLVVRGLAWSRPPDTPVEAVMTPELVSVEPSASTRSVYRLLVASGVRQVPLVESGRLVGIVGRDDLVDEETTELISRLGGCPHCGGGWLRPASTAEATNFLCLQCHGCWRLVRGAFVAVEQRSCPGCPEHNFCRFPLIDYGVDISRLPPPEERFGPDVLGVEARSPGR